jgi:cysteine desulfurase
LRARYFDNAATTPVDPRVVREMLPYLEGDFGNANSLHGFGRKAHAAVDLARERVAVLIGAEDPAQVTFTSGATEANNWVLASFLEGAVGPFEHSSVAEPAARLGIAVLENAGERICPPGSRLDLVSVMSVNNETGHRWDARTLRPWAERVHSDLTQSIGKLPEELQGLDYASFSAHKMYGPKGIGGLYTAEEPLPPLLAGGGQEQGLRAGTLNVPGIVGLGAAAAVALDEREQDEAHARELRGIVLDELKDLSGLRVNGGEDASPYILSLSFLGVEGETLLVDADTAGYAISAGAACSSESTEPSRVLVALGLEPEWLRGTVRVSFGRFNDRDSAAGLARTLRESAQKLRKLAK